VRSQFIERERDSAARFADEEIVKQAAVERDSEETVEDTVAQNSVLAAEGGGLDELCFGLAPRSS
jgi:hypothetical protein